jgi:glycosyltransferase involved in cell wall biosynthesis
MLSSIEEQCDEQGNRFSNYEHIIIDGDSTDNTVEIALTYAYRQAERGIDVTIISEPDEGIYDAMNKGIKRARGRYIGFLNTDDWYATDALALIVGDINEYDADIIGGECTIAREGKAIRMLPVRPEMIHATYPKEMPANHQALFMRTDLIREMGGFDTQFLIAADYDLCLRLIRRTQEESPDGLIAMGLVWSLIDEIIVHFSLGGASYDPLGTARDYRAVRLANGWPLLKTQLLYAKNLCAARVMRTFQRS